MEKVKHIISARLVDINLWGVISKMECKFSLEFIRNLIYFLLSMVVEVSFLQYGE